MCLFFLRLFYFLFGRRGLSNDFFLKINCCTILFYKYCLLGGIRYPCPLVSVRTSSGVLNGRCPPSILTATTYWQVWILKLTNIQLNVFIFISIQHWISLLGDLLYSNRLKLNTHPLNYYLLLCMIYNDFVFISCQLFFLSLFVQW